MPFLPPNQQHESTEVSPQNHLINKAIIDSTLHLQYTTHNDYLLVFIVEQNLIGISAVIVLLEVESSCWTVSIMTGTPWPGRRVLGCPSKTVCQASGTVGCNGPCPATSTGAATW